MYFGHWLIAEWPIDAEKPTKFFFSSLPAMASRKKLIRLAKRRWWVEHSYKELKDELGLDHFKGRSWRGWHHHVTLTMLAYVFLVELRKRLGEKGDPSLSLPSVRRLLQSLLLCFSHHCPICNRPIDDELAQVDSS